MRVQIPYEGQPDGAEPFEEIILPLRDLFAAFALAGILANSSYEYHDVTAASEQAYRTADAMLQHRVENKSQQSA